MKFKSNKQRKAVMAKIKARKFQFPVRSASQTGEVWTVKDEKGVVLCNFPRYDDAWACRNKNQRREDIEANAKKFMVERFGEKSLKDKNYVKEWVSRFKTGVPENYMDSKSRKVYERMKFGK